MGTLGPIGAPMMVPPLDQGRLGEAGVGAAAARSGAADPKSAAEPTGVSPEMLDRLRPFMTESLMVLDAEWTVRANLAPPGGLIGRGLGLGLHTLEDMHPDDAVRVMELGVEAFSTVPGWSGSKIVRMKRGDGAYGRYEITAINRFDDPVINGMVVRTREVPEELAEEWTGTRTTSTIETLAEMLPLGVLMFDPRGRVVFANATACGMVDREPETIKRGGLEPLIHADDRALVADMLRRVAAAPGREQCTVRLAGARAARVACTFSSAGVDVDEGVVSVDGDEAIGPDAVSCIVLTIEDVTDRYAAQRALEDRAARDPLTGLLNRTSLHERLRARLDAGAPTMVAYLDLDGFKAVNDTYGHERGDLLLEAVARALRAGVPAECDVARMGGDEFVVVTGTPDRRLATRLGDVVRRVAVADDLDIACSVGVATATPTDDGASVLRRADEAMYAIKAHRH